MAQQQSGQNAPQGNKNNKFNWTRLIISLLIIAGIAVLVWYFFYFNTTTIKSIFEFENDVIAASASTTDGTYFESFEIEGNLINVSFVEEFTDDDGNIITTISDYSFYATSGFIDAITNPLAGLIDGMEITTTTGDEPQTVVLDLDSTITYESLKDALTSKNDDGTFNYGEIVYAQASIWSTIFYQLLSWSPFILLIVFYLWMMKKQMGSDGGGIFSVGKNQAQKIISKVRFKDIAGQLEVKEEIVEVVDFLKNPRRYQVAGARIPKGILLSGPPGTGKTLFAKATAGEAGVPFYFISASNFVEMFAGMGAKRVREMFKEARKAAPAILFIDELDAVGRKRGSTFSGNDEREQTLNQILVEMDGMKENAGLLVIAATNMPDVLDPALQRPGRFDRSITVNLPDIKEREEILRLHAKGKRVSHEVDFANIAKRTPTYSGAQLENVINEATLLSVREGTNVITIEQIDEAIDRVQAGPSKKHRVVTKKEMEMVAYHESGHALIGLKVADADVVQKVTIIPRGKAGGYTLVTPKKEKYNLSKSEIEAKIVSLMGGRAAEQIIYGEGEVSTGASDDIDKATRYARAMVTQFGMSNLGPIAYERAQGTHQFLGQQENVREYSDALAERIDEAIRDIIIVAEKKAIVVIKKHLKLLELLKEELLEKETIVLEEVEYINKNLKRPPKRTVVKKEQENVSLDQILESVEGKKKVAKSKSQTSSTNSIKKPLEKNSSKGK